MKRNITVTAIILLACLLLLSGCSGGTDAPTADMVAQKVSKGWDGMTEMSYDEISANYYFSPKLLDDFTVMVSDSDENATEAAVFRLKESGNRGAVLEGIKKHLSERATAFQNVLESEYDKIQNRLLMELDDMIVLVITGDRDTALTTLTDMGAKEIS